MLTWEGGVDVLDPWDTNWHDDELDFDCVFAFDESGVERCFPMGRQRLKYVDSACTRPVFEKVGPEACPSPDYSYVAGVAGCTFQGFKLGAELPSSTPLFVTEEGSPCRSVEPALVGQLYELEAMPDDTFVGMQRSARARAPGLDAHVREGQDGSWQIMGYFDATRQAACFDNPSSAPGPDLKCVPALAAGQRLFSDSGCRTGIINVGDPACRLEPPTAILDAVADLNACPTTYDIRLFEIDDTRETAAHYIEASGACVPSPEVPAQAYVSGAPIDVSTFPTLDKLVLGNGPLRTQFSGFGGIAYLPLWSSGSLLSDESGDGCLPSSFPGDLLRCVSASFARTSPSDFIYEDAACSGSPVVRWSTTCGTFEPAPRAALIRDASRPCSGGASYPVSEVVAVVGTSDASIFYAKDPTSGACQSVPPTSPAPMYLQLGEALNPQEFPEMQRAIRQ